MPRTAEQQARARGGVQGYRTVKRGNRTILVAVVPQAGPRGGHTVSMAGPVSTPAPAKSRMTRKRLRKVAKRRKARTTGATR